MMKKIILTRKQLNEYINRKRDEKIFYNIINDIHYNMKNLNESISISKTNQSIIDNYNRKGLINENVFKLLKSYNIIDENYKIL